MAILKTYQAIQGLKAQEMSEACFNRVTTRYPFSITRHMLSQIDPSQAQDPLRLQFVPDHRELEQTELETSDPIGDEVHSPFPGLIHRYEDRVLLKLTHMCPVYCRFCFRREVVGPKQVKQHAPDDTQIFNYIAQHRELWEIIFSGGDSFMLPIKRLQKYYAHFEKCAHIKVVRFHTRVPIVLPSRVTEAFVEALTSCKQSVYIALHANHPNELTPEAYAACTMLRKAGCILISQSVLLKGINDNVNTLQALMRKFVEFGIKPYYLHLLDYAPGTSHFRVNLCEAQRLMLALKNKVSGIAYPQCMLDIPGGYGKVPIALPYVHQVGEKLTVLDPQGNEHRYP